MLQTIESLQDSFRSGRTKHVPYRKKQLYQLQHMIRENTDVLAQAVYKDLHKNIFEFQQTELFMVENEIAIAIANLDEWSQDEYVKTDFVNKINECYIRHEPKGVILIISPWNYPIQLSLIPVISAIAAGNCVILKPSELSSHTSKVLESLFHKYLDSNSYSIICGDAKVATELLTHRFDHIFFTGSTKVGKIVMAAAAKHLTPVTLELGGKCPCIVDSSADIELAGKRIAWAKFMNCGQTCIAPDHVICVDAEIPSGSSQDHYHAEISSGSSQVRHQLVQSIIRACQTFYGDACANKSYSYGRIINEANYERLFKILLKYDSKIIFGGKCDSASLFIEPTILTNEFNWHTIDNKMKISDELLDEEIFGPILPIIGVKDVKEAVKVINGESTPLAMYIFSEDITDQHTLMDNIQSGSVCINDCIMQVTLPTLPFGGCGDSGMGNYHGKFGFDTFTHKRSVMKRTMKYEWLMALRYPPNSKWKMRCLKELVVNMSLWEHVKNVVVGVYEYVRYYV